MGIRVVIPSKSRVGDCRTALALFPGATVVVNEEQAQQYEVLGAPLLAHPKDLWGIGPLKNWILDHVDDECVFIVDDDVYQVRSPVGSPTRSHVIRDPEAIRQFVENTAEIARGIGAPVFGFDQTGGDTRKFRPQDPMRFCGWVGAAMGIVGREIRFDPELRIRADIDFCLTAQLRRRVIVMDGRFSFIHRKRWSYPGGNSLSRSGKRNQAELAYLQRKWGEWITVQNSATTTRIVVNVERRWR